MGSLSAQVDVDPETEEQKGEWPTDMPDPDNLPMHTTEGDQR